MPQENQFNSLRVVIGSSMEMSVQSVAAVKKAKYLLRVIRKEIKNKTANIIMPCMNLWWGLTWNIVYISGRHISKRTLQNWKNTGKSKEDELFPMWKGWSVWGMVANPQRWGNLLHWTPPSASGLSESGGGDGQWTLHYILQRSVSIRYKRELIYEYLGLWECFFFFFLK